jgi:hypothetical protein
MRTPGNHREAGPRRAERRASRARSCRTGGEAGWLERLRSPQALKPLAVLAGLFAAALLVIQLPHAPLGVHKGETTTYPIIARADFDYADDEVTSDARDLAAYRVPGVYRPTTQPITAVKDGLLALVEAVRGSASADQVDETLRTAWKLDAELFDAVKTALGPSASSASRDLAAGGPAAEAGPGAENLARIQEAVGQAADALADPVNLAILSEQDHQRASDRGKDSRDLYAKLPSGLLPEGLKPLQSHELTLTVLLADTEREIPLQSVLAQTQTGIIRDRVASLVEGSLGSVLGNGVVKRLSGEIAVRLGPTLLFQAAETENRRAEARRRIEPIRIPWKKNTTLVQAGTIVGDEHLRLLAQESSAYQAELGWLRKALVWAGAAAVVALVLAMQAAAVSRFQTNVTRSTARSLLLGLLCLVVLGGSKLAVQANWPLAFSTFLLTTAALVVAVAYDARFALGLVWTLALLVTLAIQGDFAWLLTAMVGTAAAVLALGEINNRSKLIKVGLLAGLGFFLMANALAFWRLEYSAAKWWPLLRMSLEYGASGVAAGFVMLGLLPGIERAFGIVTNISLLELCDVNQSALKRLAIEAPGTYAHSLLLGTLAEAAAEAVGANGLLARVGAYFHDIGKVDKPRYFVENFQNQKQPHDNLTPPMSRLVITSHVKDGLEMADRLGLPPPIRNFIAEHHGTTLVEYFFREAQRRHAEEGGAPPVEADYRYPGPKPRSPETAIVMLADTVEGAARSLKEPTAPKIQATVHEMILKRLLDGQLEESGLTLSDLYKMEEALTKTLASVYHGRVPYPSEEPSDAQVQEPARDAGERSHGTLDGGHE